MKKLLLNLDKLKIPNAKIEAVPGFTITKPSKDKGPYKCKTYYLKNKSGVIGLRVLLNKNNTPKELTILAADLNHYVSFILDPTKLTKENGEKLKVLLEKQLGDINFKQMSNMIVQKKIGKFIETEYKNLTKHKTPLKEELSVKNSAEIMQWFYILSIITVAVSVYFYFYNIAKDYYYKSVESEAESKLEQKINEALFNKQTGKEKDFEVFSDTINHIERVIDRQAPALILAGPPGHSKTYIVRRTLHFKKLVPGKDYVIIKGATLGLIEFFQILYDYRNKLIIMDDFDTPLKDPDMLNILKSITDSYSIRIVTVPMERVRAVAGATSAAPAAIADMPRKFEFKGRVIIITNLEKDKIDPALLSRAPTIEIKFDTKRMISILSKMLKYMYPDVDMKIKQEVYDFLVELYKKHKNKVKIDFRVLQTAIGIRLSMKDEWKQLVLIVTGLKNS